MPSLPKSKKRSWIPKRKKVYGQHDNSSFYHSKQWRMLRNWYIKKYPICAECNRQGKLTAGYCVDHIRPISIGGNKIDISNLQTLCESCHAKKSAQESAEYRKGIKNYVRKK